MSSNRTLPNLIYTSGLDDVSKRVLGNAKQIAYADVRDEYLPELAKVAEALLIAPRVVLKVSSRSLILPILLDYFQGDVILELLREGALEFIVWTHGVASLGSVVMGIPNPREVERDPGSIAERDLRMCFPGLDLGLERELVDSFVRRTTATNGDDAEEAINIAMQFAEQGVFGDRIPGKNAFIDAEPAITAAARNTAQDLYETSVVLGNEYDLFETDGTWDAIARIAEDIKRSAGAVDAVESVYAEGSVPSVRSLLLEGRLSPMELLRFRNHPATRAFQRWLWKADDVTDGRALAGEFLRALDAGLDPKDGALYRNARILIASFMSEGVNRLFSAGGAVAGAAVGGVPGAALGAVAGFAGGTLVNLAEPRIPEFFTKPDPRKYIDNVLRPLSKIPRHP